MSAYIYILVMAVVTYLIRMLPLTIFKKKIENKFIKSFLYYVPYACLMAMTFPAVLGATDSLQSAIAGAGVAIIFALFDRGLMTVAVAASITAFVVQLIF